MGKTVEAGVRASKGGPKAEKLAPRQGIWDAGGETRLHREKTGLVLGVRREAEAKGQEENGGREKEKPGQTAEGRAGVGVKARSHLSATRVGWRRRELGDQKGSVGPAALLLACSGKGTRRKVWKQKMGRRTSRRETEIRGGLKKKKTEPGRRQHYLPYPNVAWQSLFLD